jgi:hypothetical protein
MKLKPRWVEDGRELQLKFLINQMIHYLQFQIPGFLMTKKKFLNG